MRITARSQSGGSTMEQIWSAFKGWNKPTQVVAVVLAPWLIIAAWAIATHRSRWLSIGVPVLVGFFWLSAVAAPFSSETEPVRKVKGSTTTSSTDTDQAAVSESSTTSLTSSTTTAPAAPPTTVRTVATTAPPNPTTRVTSPPPTTAATSPPPPSSNCHPSYDPCVPIASDVDCLGGSGNGPAYTGPVRVIGPDVYDLDRDGDGYGCE